MRVETVTVQLVRYRTPDGAMHDDLVSAEDRATDLAIEKLSEATVEDFRALKAGAVGREDPLRLSFMWFARHVATAVPVTDAPGIGHNGGPALEEKPEEMAREHTEAEIGAAMAAPVVDMDAFARTLAGHG